MNKNTTVSSPSIASVVAEAQTGPTAELLASKSLIPRLKTNQLVKLTEAECIERNLPSTSKAKPRLGIENDREISWAPANFELPTHSVLRGFCKKHGFAIDEFLAAVAMTWVDDNLDALRLEAADYIAQVHTEESAKKKMESLQRQLATATALLASFAKAEAEESKDKKSAE